MFNVDVLSVTVQMSRNPWRFSQNPLWAKKSVKMPQIWPFALRHEHNLCKKKSCMEKCLPRLERCHGSLKGDATQHKHTQQGVNPCASSANQNILLTINHIRPKAKSYNLLYSIAVLFFLNKWVSFLLIAWTHKMQWNVIDNLVTYTFDFRKLNVYLN